MSKAKKITNRNSHQRDFASEYNEIMKFANREVRNTKKSFSIPYSIEKFSLIEETLSPNLTNNTSPIN